MNMVMADAGNYPETAIINIRLGGAVEYFRLMFGAFEKMMMRSREEGPARASRHGMNYSEEEEEERSGWNSLRKMSEVINQTFRDAPMTVAAEMISEIKAPFIATNTSSCFSPIVTVTASMFSYLPGLRMSATKSQP
jgi:hypothetical protein